MNNAIAAYRLNQDELDELHRVAHSAYLQGRYVEAARYFWFLSLHVPTDVRYLKGLAAGMFMARNFTQAAVACLLLRKIAHEDPEVSCMLGHTLLMLGQRDLAKLYLENAMRLPGGEPAITARAHALIEFLGN